MYFNSCVTCGLHLRPTKSVRLDREWHCDDCQKAVEMVEDFDAHNRPPHIGLSLQRVCIHWRADDVHNSTSVSRARLTWELSAFLRGGFIIKKLELLP